jgi:hypothetical protein
LRTGIEIEHQRIVACPIGHDGGIGKQSRIVWILLQQRLERSQRNRGVALTRLNDCCFALCARRIGCRGMDRIHKQNYSD